MSLYGLFLGGASCLGPIIAGFINDNCGYEWVFYVPTILGAFVTVVIFFFMEETNYVRKTTVVQGVEVPGVALGTESLSNAEEKNVGQPSTAAADDAVETPPMAVSTKTYRQKLALFDISKHNNLGTFFANQLRFCTYPIVLFCGFEYGMALFCVVVLGVTSSEILSAPPYYFKASMVGLSNVGPLIGVIVG